MLSWVCLAQRPLTLDEFRDALAIEGFEADSTLFQQHLAKCRLQPLVGQNWAFLEREILHTCGGLLEVVRHPHTKAQVKTGVQQPLISPEDIVQVTHQTVREFLFSGPARAGAFGLDCKTSSGLITRSLNAYIWCSIDWLSKAMHGMRQHLYKSPHRMELEDDFSLKPSEDIAKGIAEITNYLSDLPLLIYAASCHSNHFTSDSVELALKPIQVENQKFIYRDGDLLHTIIWLVLADACNRRCLRVVRLILDSDLGRNAPGRILEACAQAVRSENLATLAYILSRGPLRRDPYAHSRQLERAVRRGLS